MGFLFLDLAIFAVSIWNAVVNRGTVWGWLSTLVVLWMSFVFIKMLKEI